MRNRLIILLGILFASFSVNAQCERDTIIYWGKNHKLRWCDFQGKVPIRCGKDKAMASLAIHTSYVNKWYSVDVKALCFFKKKEAWKKDTSLLLLKHEQLHFDIAELYARRIRKGVSDLKNTHETSIEEYKKIVETLLREHKTYNEQYDEETAHSVNRVKQAEWEKKVAKELETLKEYEVDYSEYIEE